MSYGQGTCGRRSASKANKGQPGGPGLRHYWDLISYDYEADPEMDGGLCASIVDFLAREGVFMPGDTVLDIGCGTGTYALLFAGAARLVAGLDVSEAMLSKMAGAAKASGIDNIRPVRSSWEKFDPSKKYDLAFSSFCPAISDAGALGRMEERSKRSCCCVIPGDPESDTPAERLREILTGESADSGGSDSLYLFNVLHYSGRSPSLRSFNYESATEVPSERLMDHFIAYFGLYMEMDNRKKEKVKDYVDSISDGGVYRHSGRKAVSVIYWHV